MNYLILKEASIQEATKIAGFSLPRCAFKGILLQLLLRHAKISGEPELTAVRGTISKIRKCPLDAVWRLHDVSILLLIHCSGKIMLTSAANPST